MFKKDLLIDHSLISKEIEKRLKNKLWNSLQNELPNGTLIVGGFLRDIISGKNEKRPDIDLIVPVNPLTIADKIVSKFKVKFIVLDKKRNVVRINFDQFILDIAEQVGGSLLGDLSSRDFTMNSIAFSLDSRKIVDPLNGINDLKKGLIKTQNNNNLLDDPLRILRCFRFVSELNFKVDRKLYEFIRINKNKMSSVSEERIQYELKKIYEGKNALSTTLSINKLKIFDWIQSYKTISSIYLESYKHINSNFFAKDEHKILFYLIETLDKSSIKHFKFSKADNQNSIILRKWKHRLIAKPIEQFDEIERFDLHKELENILPSFIVYLPNRLHSEWFKRWKNKKDRLFHPQNLINGDILKQYIDIKDGPLLGKLLRYLSIEFAYHRLNNFDEAIYDAKQWFKQNAPKCD